ncbi:hypothetical protein MMC14_008726 [Varicellaria rhodocarpa]|nr:hypothetical protein [Varicellaria rhodocarpa]
MPHSTPIPSSAGEPGWSTTAPTYSSNVGRTSALAASRLISLAQTLSPITPSSSILDNGAGTGAITLAIAAAHPSTSILATDISGPMLTSITSASTNSNQSKNQSFTKISTRVLDARSLTSTLKKDSFTHVFNTFMLQTITTPLDALREMHTVLKPNGEGVIGIALWASRNDPFSIWRSACLSLDPDYTLPAPFDDPHAWRTVDELDSALRELGFRDVRCEEMRMPFTFESSAAFVEFWFGAKNPAAVKVMANWEGDGEEVRRRVARVVEEEYGGGKDVCTWAVLGVGRKSMSG